MSSTYFGLGLEGLKYPGPFSTVSVLADFGRSDQTTDLCCSTVLDMSVASHTSGKIMKNLKKNKTISF